MKIAIVAPSPVPFTRGGAERAASGLLDAVNDGTPHDAELVKVPVREQTLAGLVAGYAAFARLDLSHFDAVISSKYPAWIAPHPNHTVHMFHPLRGLYDTYHLFKLPRSVRYDDRSVRELSALARAITDRGPLDELFASFDRVCERLGPDHPALALPGPLAREIVHGLDRVALAPGAMRRHFALSRTVAARPGYFPAGARPRVVYLPSDLPAREGAAHHLFTASRLDGAKRLDLLIRAMAQVPAPITLVIAGTGPAEAELRALAAGDPRIRFVGFVPDEQLTGWYADALAVPFVPQDEDLGLITLEAMACATPVVTCRDSGGPTEFVVDGETGLVTDPTPESLGQGLARLAADPAAAARMGKAGQRRAATVTWSRAVATLLGVHPFTEPVAFAPSGAPARHGAPAGAAGRPKVVVTSTFAINPPRGGGQLRCYHLYGALARHVDVEVVCLVDARAAPSSQEILPGLTETVVPASPAHSALGSALSEEAGLPVTDIVAGTHIARSPAYLAALGAAADGADVVLLAHPYLLPAVEAVCARLPRLYDAHNLEAELKAAVLPATVLGRRLRRDVEAVEGRAVSASAAVTVCSAAEAAAFLALYGGPPERFTVIPNGTDTARVPVSAEQRAEAGRRWRRRFNAQRPGLPATEHLAVFFGSWHPPNLDAAELIIDAAAALPHAAFLLGGSHGEAFRHRALPANVVLAGIVGDRAKHALLDAADVALNPMRLGAGTNLKIIEYLANGVPVVSTPFGARGLAVTDGEHLLLAEPADTATALTATFADPIAAARRSRAGRALVVDDYDWQALGDHLASVVSGVLAVGAPLHR